MILYSKEDFISCCGLRSIIDEKQSTGVSVAVWNHEFEYMCVISPKGEHIKTMGFRNCLKTPIDQSFQFIRPEEVFALTSIKKLQIYSSIRFNHFGCNQDNLPKAYSVQDFMEDTFIGWNGLSLCPCCKFEPLVSKRYRKLENEEVLRLSLNIIMKDPFVSYAICQAYLDMFLKGYKLTRFHCCQETRRAIGFDENVKFKVCRSRKVFSKKNLDQPEFLLSIEMLEEYSKSEKKESNRLHRSLCGLKQMFGEGCRMIKAFYSVEKIFYLEVSDPLNDIQNPKEFGSTLQNKKKDHRSKIRPQLRSSSKV